MQLRIYEVIAFKNQFLEMADYNNRPEKTTIFNGGWQKKQSLEIICSKTVVLNRPPLKMSSFQGAVYLTEPSLQMYI